MTNIDHTLLEAFTQACKSLDLLKETLLPYDSLLKHLGCKSINECGASDKIKYAHILLKLQKGEKEI